MKSRKVRSPKKLRKTKNLKRMKHNSITKGNWQNLRLKRQNLRMSSNIWKLSWQLTNTMRKILTKRKFHQKC